MATHLTATEMTGIRAMKHLSYGIPHCYLPPDTNENAPPLTPARQADTQFTDPRGMEGWVDVGSWLYSEMVYLTTDRESHTQAVTTW